AVGANRHLRALDLGREQEGLVRLAQPWVTQQEEARILMIERSWLPNQMHTHLFEEMVTFTPITGTAAGNQIFPCALATARPRDDVVKCEVTPALPTVLAGLVVAQQNVGAGRP